MAYCKILIFPNYSAFWRRTNEIERVIGDVTALHAACSYDVNNETENKFLIYRVLRVWKENDVKVYTHRHTHIYTVKHLFMLKFVVFILQISTKNS